MDHWLSNLRRALGLILDFKVDYEIDRLSSGEFYAFALLLLLCGLSFWILLYNAHLTFFSSPLSVILIPEKSSNPIKVKDTLGTRKKFKVAVWKAINSSTLFLFGYYVLASQSWTFDYVNYGAPQDKIPLLMAAYYLLTISSYIYGTYVLVYVEPRLKDFYQMLFHHMVTLFLTIGSLCIGTIRIGAIVMILHDVGDPFMEVAKVCLYGGLTWAANAVFLAFASVFIISRCVVYPIFAIWPLFHQPELNLIRLTSYQYIGALCIIQVLNLYWSYLILCMLSASITKRAPVEKDIRED